MPIHDNFANHPESRELILERGYENSPVVAAETGIGQCQEKAAIITAICRANGFPARIVGGQKAFRKRMHLLAEAHYWAEIFDGKDWVAVDTVRPSFFDTSRFKAKEKNINVESDSEVRKGVLKLDLK